MQAIKIDRVVVARRMQHHAVRRRPGFFVADLGIAHETSMARATPGMLGSQPLACVAADGNGVSQLRAGRRLKVEIDDLEKTNIILRRLKLNHHA